MSDANDWRLTNQMNYFFGKELLHTKYKPYRPGWEHDHCDFCSVKIDSLTPSAYCTTDYYHWVCENCFSDFCSVFKWKIVSTNV